MCDITIPGLPREIRGASDLHYSNGVGTPVSITSIYQPFPTSKILWPTRNTHNFINTLFLEISPFCTLFLEIFPFCTLFLEISPFCTLFLKISPFCTLFLEISPFYTLFLKITPFLQFVPNVSVPHLRTLNLILLQISDLFKIYHLPKFTIPNNLRLNLSFQQTFEPFFKGFQLLVCGQNVHSHLHSKF